MKQDLLQCWGDSLSGKVGFSFTSRSVNAVAQAVFRYCNSHFINKVCLGYDGRQFSDLFSFELVNSLAEMGIPTVVIDGPSPIFLLSWLSSQTDLNTKTIGIYIGGDQAPFDQLSLSFRNDDGSPFVYERTREIYNHYIFSLRSSWDHKDRKRDPEYVDLREGYAQWLVDTLNIEKRKSLHTIGIDYLTSPAKPYLQQFLMRLNIGALAIPEEFWHTPIVHKQLRPCPFGWPLTYPHTKFSREVDYHFSFDGDADCIGIYDNLTGEGLSASATFVILLYYFSKIKNRRGTILISRAVSEKVSVIAESYGLSVEYVDGGLSGLSSKLKEKRKRAALMYGDEEGGFWFKGLPLDRNPFPAIIYVIEACEHTGLSPAQLYDKIVDKELGRKFVFGKIDISPSHVSQEKLLEFISTDSSVGNKSITERITGSLFEGLNFTAHTLKLEDSSRVVIQSNLKNDFIELYVESYDQENMHQIMGDIQGRIFSNDSGLS